MAQRSIGISYVTISIHHLQQEDLVVTKKQPNVLDKPKSSQGGGGKPQQNNGAGAATSQDVDVRKLTVRFEKLITGSVCLNN